MKRILLALLALLLCFCTSLCLFSCQKKLTEEEWRAAFAFENVRVDCVTEPWQQEPSFKTPLYNGSHFLFDGEKAAVANVSEQLIGESEPTFYEKLFRERREILRLFDFSDCFDEFTRQKDGTYFCEKSSRKNVVWQNDCIKNVSVTITDGLVSKISYTYYVTEISAPTIYTFTFSEYGQVVLQAPAE